MVPVAEGLRQLSGDGAQRVGQRMGTLPISRRT